MVKKTKEKNSYNCWIIKSLPQNKEILEIEKITSSLENAEALATQLGLIPLN